jgi:hypothetical protein
MGTNPLAVATIAYETQIDHAIATLVLAFVTDPVARWMYDDPHQYLLHIPRLFRALGTSSFEAGAEQRTNDGLGVARRKHRWGEANRSRRDLRTDGTLSADRAPLVLVADRGRRIASEQRMRCSTTSAPASSMRPGAAPSLPLVIEPAKYPSLRETWLQDLGNDPSRLVAFNLSHAALCALKIRRARGRTITPGT